MENIIQAPYLFGYWDAIRCASASRKIEHPSYFVGYDDGLADLDLLLQGEGELLQALNKINKMIADGGYTR